jgi:hypothetical protein
VNDRKADEILQVRAKIDAAAKGELDMIVYTSREELYANLELGDASTTPASS